jgi:hypothetical protein
MTSDIQKLIDAVPFIPFTIYLADGGQVRVPTVDHIALSPTGKRVIVFHDDDSSEVLSPLLISRVSIDRGSVSGTG